MRRHWLNFENTQSEKAIVGSACSLSLLVLLVTLSGCIVTYRDFPNATLESLPKDHEPKPLYYHVEPLGKAGGSFTENLMTLILPGWYPFFPQVDPVGRPGYHEVGRTLKASGLFSDLIMDPDRGAGTGVYCNIQFEIRNPSLWVTGYFGAQGVVGILSGGMLMPVPAFTLLPYYTGEGGTTVGYTLYRDGQLTQTYRYPITKKGAGWIVLLPFAWLNFFTNDLKDAVRGATLQFLIDAQRDGNL
jgi:hypothetical protein